MGRIHRRHYGLRQRQAGYRAVWMATASDRCRRGTTPGGRPNSRLPQLLLGRVDETGLANRRAGMPSLPRPHAAVSFDLLPMLRYEKFWPASTSIERDVLNCSAKNSMDKYNGSDLPICRRP